MSVQQHDPRELIKVTPQAAKHLLERVMREQGRGIFFGVDHTGCSGLMYALRVVADQPAATQSMVLSNNLTLYIDTKSVPFVQGTEIDYIQEGLNWSLTYRNPLAANDCGCGKSFNVPTPSDNPTSPD